MVISNLCVKSIVNSVLKLLLYNQKAIVYIAASKVKKRVHIDLENIYIQAIVHGALRP